MNIGLVVPGFSADETDWCIPALRNLAAWLAREDDVRVFALRYPYRSSRYELSGAQVISLGGGVARGLGSAALWTRALSLLAAEHRQRPFDLLHAFWAGETGLLAAIAGKVLGVPTIVSIAGGELAALREISYGGQLVVSERSRIRIALRLAQQVTAGSRHLISIAANHVAAPKNGLRWAPLGVDTRAFRPRDRAADPGRPHLIQAASLVPVKDQMTLIRAAGLLRDMGTEFCLEIAGTGPIEGALTWQIANLGLRDHVALKGDILHDLLPGFYRDATVYVQSSLHEAQGMALLEAAACGVPSIGTRAGTLVELEPEAALGVPTGDASQLAAALATLLRDPSRQSAMGNRARSIVQAHYSMEACVERFRSIYAELA